jgi:hypothetical protein
MTAKVVALHVGPGIQRDGTLFASVSYVDGKWVRFQYGRPRKIAGYNASFLNAKGVSRGMIMSSQDGINYVISGYSNGLEQWTTDNDDAVGSGPTNIEPVGPLSSITIVSQGTGYTNGTYTNVAIVTGSGAGTGARVTVVVSSNLVFSVTVTTAGTGYVHNDTVTIPSASIGGTGSGFAGYVESLTYYNPNPNTLWQMDIGYDPYGTGNNNLIAHPGQNLYDISSTTNTRPMIGAFTGTTMNPVGVFTASGTTTNGSPNVTFATTNIAMGAGVTVTGTGIPASTTIVSSGLVSNAITLAGVAVTGTAGQFSCSATTLLLNQEVVVTGTLTGTATGISAGTYYIIATNGTTTFTLSTTKGGTAITTTAGTTAGLTFVAQLSSVWTVVLSNNATASGTVTLTFDNNISVSGGVVMLYPYLFVYGNNGLIQNCSAGDFNNWTSADSNANNIASTKVVKGLPLRGGTTSPAGLFWTLDSVIRVTYSPQQVGTSTLYWRYDLITQQSSILSSACVIEYDGIYFWAGTDRFLMYNGVVQEVPNNQNFNYFFDNLNYNQRQKVWASKVPRWGEIWWFFPSGDSEECNDAVIYNIREKCWYDAGQALGARRSAGVFSEVFRRPIWGGWEENNTGEYTLWQHEKGTNQVYTNNVDAIESYVETNIISGSVGLVGTVQGAGDNVWTRLERVEPDFVQNGQMELIVTGKSYAEDVDDPSDPYPFDPTTLKIDMKEQRREMRLRFGSNTRNGDYFMGRVILSIDTGDVRGTGNP